MTDGTYVIPNGKYILGCDVSQYNKYETNMLGLNWAKAYDNGIRFAFLRALGFNGDTNMPRKDRDIDLNWRQTKENKIIRGCYVFGVWIKDWKTNLDALKLVYPNKYDGELPVALDVEPYAKWGNYPAKVNFLVWIQDLMKAIDDWSGKSTIFYTNPATIKYLSPIPDWLKSKIIWVANYGVVSPQLYGQWDKWSFWQFTDHMQASNYGMDSKELDGNYWNGTLEELYQYANYKQINVEIPKPVLTLEQRIEKLENWATKLGYLK